jgi:hypothetical protein
VATDAGASSGLAWGATVLAAVLVACGIAARSSVPVHTGVAVLGLALLLRHDARLVLAPLYGAGLLLVAELGTRSIELAGVARVGPGVIGARLGATVALAAAGACAAAGVALAVTAAPGRSVALTAVGAIAAVATCGAVARIARRRQPPG